MKTKKLGQSAPDTTTSQNQDVDTESVVASATSDFNFEDDDSLTKMPGSTMETEPR